MNLSQFFKTKFSFIFVSLLFVSAAAQDNNFKDEYALIIPDRSVYLNGETIFFTAYYENYFPQNSAKFSNILYVEAYNKRETLTEAKFRIRGNIIKGSLDLPENAYSGNYFLRAYTKFQRNMPAERMHHVLISVINPDRPFPKEDETNEAVVDVLKAQSDSMYCYFRFNKPSPTNGSLIIKNDSGRVLKTISPGQSRNRTLTYAADECQGQIAAFISSPGDTTVLGSLADFPENAADIRLQKDSAQARLWVNVKNALKAQHGRDMKLQVFNKNFEPLSDRLFDASKKNSLIFKSEIFKETGIYYFVLQNFNSEILYVTAQYLWEPEKKADDFLKLSPKAFALRTEVNPEISDTSDYDYAVISVPMKGLEFDHRYYLPRHLTFSHTLLRSWLQTHPVKSRQTVRQINAALQWQNKELNSQMFRENLLFRFPHPVSYIPDIRDVSIAGKASYTNTGKPAGDIDVFASVVYGEDQIHHVRTDEQGNFVFSLNKLGGEQNVFITAAEDREKIKTEVVSDFDTRKTIPEQLPLLADTSRSELIRQLYLNKQLKDIFGRATEHSEKNQSFETVNFDGLQNISIVLDDYIPMPTMEDVFHELVPYVKVTERKQDYKLSVYNEELRYFSENPLILVDYMPVFDPNELMAVDPEKAEKIDVINQHFVLGQYFFESIILVTTNTKDFAGISIPEQSVYLKYTGIQNTELLQFPDYSKKARKKSRKADFRHQLFYRAFSGELPAVVKFYTSDLSGDYKVILLGRRKNKKPALSIESFSTGE